jgi:hypothetical protein
MAVAIAERSSGTIGHITLEVKCAGARSAGKCAVDDSWLVAERATSGIPCSPE